jgi:diguanylate cyclase (GGDEF)-like protein
VSAEIRSPAAEEQNRTWTRIRRTAVLPITVLVAVALVCIVVAALTSAHRADQVALENEKELFTRALSDQGQRALRELESVATTVEATLAVKGGFNRPWIRRSIETPLKTAFGHSFLFVFDGEDELGYFPGDDPARFKVIAGQLRPVIDFVRGRPMADSARTITLTETFDSNAVKPRRRAALLQDVLGLPAVVAAVAVLPYDRTLFTADQTVPIAVTVKFIDEYLLAEIAGHVHLRNLHKVDAYTTSAHDYMLDLVDGRGQAVTSFAWTPIKPGQAIFLSVVPYIVLAFGGFSLLAIFMFRYMRKSAATIAAGEVRMRHLALHDSLSGLPNRIFFGDRLGSLIDTVRVSGRTAALFYIDLDYFKDVNDTFGHPAGDELINHVAARLLRTIRSEDLVARLGGDEFAVVTLTDADVGRAEAIGQRIISLLSEPYDINGKRIFIGASIGVAMLDDTVESAADVMRHADMALYRAKNEGRSRACMYDAEMDADHSQRKILEGDLRQALDAGSLEVAYQPIVDNAGDTVVSVEALARWNHPERGPIPPAEFIPLAEHSGLIIELGEWVLRRACLDGRQWPGVTVSVNVSPLQFRRTDFVDLVERVLAETGFDPAYLEIEVTESTLLGNIDAAEAAMLRLKSLGVRLALDDFGTGYSSLQYLRRFPFDKLKIDRSFVKIMGETADNATVLHAIVSLGRGLGMKVTAEGVETNEQHRFLTAAGVHSMQGYRFGVPIPACEIAARLIAAPRDWAREAAAAALAG